MKLSISNIAWSAEHDEEMYGFLHSAGFTGLEIAPTRIFPEKPYQHLNEAKEFANRLFEEYGLRISSMQSIWYGITKNIFGTAEDRQILLDYTKSAIDFAAAIECGNLVFGCPKNRNVPERISCKEQIAIDFFSGIAAYAAENGTVIALEPNPPIYGTNFINETTAAFKFCRTAGKKGLKVNIDLGTMIFYNEPVSLISDNLNDVNHIHISEPKLAPLEKRKTHREMLALPFDGYFSIEMANAGNLSIVKQQVGYIAELAKEVKA